jgi:hypothetical protein
MEKVLRLYTYINGINDTPFVDDGVNIEVYSYRYDAKRMGGSPSITCSIKHSRCLDDIWNSKVYVNFNGEKFFLKNTPTSSFSNQDTRYTHEVEFVSERSILENVYLYDVVDADSNFDSLLHNSASFTFFGDISDVVRKINESLEYSNIGYVVIVDDGISSEEKLISFNNNYINDALQEVYKIFDIPYYFNGKTIHFGLSQHNIERVFKYGKDNSLISIKKQNANARIVNRITGFGSADNIPYYYPNDDKKGVTRILYNGTSGIAVISDSSKYRKVKLNDVFTFVENFSQQIPIVNKKEYILGDVNRIFNGQEGYFYKIDFYYRVKFDEPTTVRFDISSDSESVVDLYYEIYNINGVHQGVFRGENNFNLAGGTYNFIVRAELKLDYVIEIPDVDVSALIDDLLNINIEKTVEASNQWLLNNSSVKLSDYGISINRTPRNGDKITIDLVKYIQPQTHLMPSIYRQTSGSERFYNAKNNTYKNENGVFYVFENEYYKESPKELILELSDIKPTIKGITNANGERIDSFIGFAYDLNDNDEFDENGNYVHPYFFGKLRRFNGAHGFNLFDSAIEDGEMTISMTTGACGSCNFVIGVDSNTQKNTVQVDANGNLLRDSNGNVRFGTPQDVQNDTFNNEVWVALKKDINTFGVIMPNASANYRPYSNDTFVILHIDLPKAYIVAAEDRLTSALIKNMYDNNYEKFTFSISFSRIFFAENKDLSLLINENSRIKISYNGNEYDLYISSFSYTLDNNSPLPEVVVELTDKLSTSQNSINDAISETKSEILSKIDNSTHWMDIQGKPSWITSQKPTYSYNELTGTPNISGGSGGGYWELKTTERGEQYIFSKLNVVVQKGVTSYADDSDLDLPSIYDGLVIDNQTIYWAEIKEEAGTDEEGNPIYKTTKVLKAKGGNGGNSGGGTGSSFTVGESGGGNAYTSYTFVDGVLTLVKGDKFALESTVKTLQGDFTSMLLVLGQKLDESTFETWKSANEQFISNGNTAWGWGNHAKAGYVDETTLATALSKYVDLDTPQNISGEKNFTGGLLVKGQKIEYIQTDNSKGYWKLEGDLLVTGGITSFASSSGYTPSTIMDAIVCDNQTITIEDVDGVKMLKVIGGNSGGSTTASLTIEYDGSGNAITDLSYKDGVLTATRKTIFAAKTGLDAINTRVTALENTINSGGSSSGSFNIDESGGGNAYTSYTYANGKLTLKKDTLFATASQLSTLSGTVANKADKSSVYTKTEIDNALKSYVTVDGTEMQTITGKKNFTTGGLFVNGKQIKYNSKGYWELEGDLLVTGGITSFASSSGFKPSTIMDGIVCDEQTITVDVINGVKTLKVIGGVSNTIYWKDIKDAPTSLKNPFALVINGTTYDGSKKVEINISGGSNNTQSIYPLTINDSNGVTQLTYDPSSKQETLALTKSMVGLGNVENTSLSSWTGSNKITTVGTISSGTWQGTPISNSKLAKSSIEIAETSVSLGGSITSATLKTKLDIVTLSDEQHINGKKHFDSGLTIGGGEIEYNEDGYWKLTGNLLVTGGITSYSSDGKATPFLLDVTEFDEITSNSTTQVYTANAVSLLKTKLETVDEKADASATRISDLKTALEGLSATNVTALVRALQNLVF